MSASLDLFLSVSSWTSFYRGWIFPRWNLLSVFAAKLLFWFSYLVSLFVFGSRLYRRSETVVKYTFITSLTAKWGFGIEPVIRDLFDIGQSNTFGSLHVTFLHHEVFLKGNENFLCGNLCCDSDVLKNGDMAHLPGKAHALRFDILEYVEDLINFILSVFYCIGCIRMKIPGQANRR